MELLGVQIELPSNTPMMVLREEGGGRRGLPIMIATPEAAAIHSALEGITPPRPLTHDLLVGVVAALGATVHHVVITELREHTFFAELHLEAPSGAVVVSCRPSDAVALAVRTGAPIHATEAVLDEAGVEFEEETEGEDDEAILDEFRDFLDEVRPEDFEP